MAEPVIPIEATNLFGLGAAFSTSASSTSTPETNVAVNDEVGNVACQVNISDMINYTQSASYCGSDFITDLGTFLSQFGDAQTGTVAVAVTGLSINMTASGYVTVELTGHNHVANAHAAGLTLGYADVSNFLPHEATEAFISWDGFGIPAFGITVGTDASPASASVSFTMSHVDQTDETGAHLTGKNITPRCELSMDFSGLPTSQTAAALETDFGGNENDMLVPLVDSVDFNDSNAGFDTMAFTAHANTDLATE